jgi:hypothetical protein
MTTDWLRALEGPGYIWEQRSLPASEAELAELVAFFGRPLPQDYEAFLRCSNGGYLQYKDLWEIRFWRSGDIPRWSAAYGFVPARMPGAVAFADLPGGEGLVFDIRTDHADQHYPILAVNFVTIGWEETLVVATDFRALVSRDRELLHR